LSSYLFTVEAELAEIFTGFLRGLGASAVSSESELSL